MKIVCVSDTHCATPELPEGDVLVHAGDLTYRGKEHELLGQFSWLAKQTDNYDAVIVIPGNHDFGLESDFDSFKRVADNIGVTLLNETSATVNGVNFFGSPITPWFHDWAFNRRAGEINPHWAKIPGSTDVLITHGPPFEILDMTDGGERVGCPALLKRIGELPNLKLHVFGHIHECGGKTLTRNNVTYCNASIMSLSYKPVNVPIMVEI